MKILVACEESGTLRDILRDYGHEAWSNDLEGVEPRGKYPNYHLFGDALWFTQEQWQKWDMMIAFPPCTFLCNSGVRWLERGANKERMQQMRHAAHFFIKLHRADIPKIVLENPIQHKYARQFGVLPPSQIIQPWQFGHKEMKSTCLWLKGVPPLKPTKIVGPPPKDPQERKHWAVVHRASPGPNRSRDRSKTYSGIAHAMALQWAGKIGGFRA